jgi:NAD(P)-dependent dehydrogenase (short-subunit alcohol dehydrogenase family)
MKGASEMTDPVALVTGAARRIGRDIALRLAREGYSLVLHYGASRDLAEQLAREITAGGGRAIGLAADLADPETAQRLLATATAKLGPVRLLVNNAAIFHSDDLASLDLQLWRRQFAVNVEAPVFLSRAFALHLPAAMEGSIVNIIDHRVWRLTPQHLSYTLSKSALWTATQTLAQALAPRIRVNAVGPGPTYPNPSDGALGLSREAAGVLLQRPVTGDEIAEAVVYLAKARNVTGQLIAVDAGQHLAWRTPDIVD